jgi:hypothetical protein
MTAAEPDGPARAPLAGTLDAKDLLLADVQHFESAMARNEETGEKRFSFLISLLTAVCGGLGALYTSNDVDLTRVARVAAGASLALAGFALLTFLRLIHRNRVTDEHKSTLAYIRRTYRELCPDLADREYRVPAAGSRARGVFRGGYAEMTAVVAAVLVGAWVRLGMEAGWLATVASGLGVVIVLAMVAARARGGGSDDPPEPVSAPGPRG